MDPLVEEKTSFFPRHFLWALLFVNLLTGGISYLEAKSWTHVLKVLGMVDGAWILLLLPLGSAARTALREVSRTGWRTAKSLFFLYWTGGAFFFIGWKIFPQTQTLFPHPWSWDAAAVLWLLGAFHAWSALGTARCRFCGGPFLDDKSSFFFIFPWEFDRCHGCGKPWPKGEGTGV